jgi:hypothetical protein
MTPRHHNDLWTPSPADMGPRILKQPLNSSLHMGTTSETSSGDIKQAPVAAPYDWNALLNSLPNYSFRGANVSRRATYFNNLEASDLAALRFTEYVHLPRLWEQNSVLISLTQLRCDRNRCRMEAYKEKG